MNINYISNIDTICILVDIENYENNSKKILNFLDEEKEKAKLTAISSADYKHLLTINEVEFQILPFSTQGYAYILRNNSYEVKIARYRSKLKNFYPIQMRISSEALWSNGANSSWNSFCEWCEKTFGKIINNKVCRLDLCTHISGIDLVTNFDILYKGKFKKKNSTYTGNFINCITFGSRKSGIVYCRIYNKSLELQEQHHKYWFREIWKNNGLDIQNVWNVEFEIKSNLLRKFRISTFQDIMYYIRDLWEYCTKEWLIKVDRTNKRIERCNVSEEWIKIQNTYNSFISKGLIAPTQISEIEAEELIPNITGLVTSFSARKGEKNIEIVLKNLKENITDYLKKKNRTFENDVINKMALLPQSEVSKNE